MKSEKRRQEEMGRGRKKRQSLDRFLGVAATLTDCSQMGQRGTCTRTLYVPLFSLLSSRFFTLFSLPSSSRLTRTHATCISSSCICTVRTRQAIYASGPLQAKGERRCSPPKRVCRRSGVAPPRHRLEFIGWTPRPFG